MGDSVSYVRREIDSDEGLPETQVNAIAQTPDGYLWLGTRRGVVRYDGLTFRLFSPEDNPALGTGLINGLVADSLGRLWIATAHGLAVREHGVFRRIATTEIPDLPTWEVLVDRRGRVWVAGAFGLRRGDGVKYSAVPGADAYTYSLTQGNDGRVWMAGREFLASIGDGDSSIVRVPDSFTAGERFFDTVTDGGDGLWVGTRRGALHLTVADPHAVRVLQRVAPGDGGAGNEVWSIARSPLGDIWIGTELRGVLRWDGSTLTSYNPAARQFSDPVWAVFTDARGRIWAGTSAGMLGFQRSAFATFNRGLSPRSTWSVREDGVSGLLAASSDGTTHRMLGSAWIPVTPSVGRNISSTTWPRAAGGVLVVRDSRRVLLVTGTRYVDVTRTLGLEGMSLNSIFEDTDGSYWVTSNRGLQHVVNGVARPAWRGSGLDSTASPRVLMRDPQGRLLIGGPFVSIVDRDSVTRIDSTRGLSDHDVLALYPDAGNLWIGTADSGLFVWRHGRVTALGRADARLGREVLGIVGDDLGYLWITSSFGLFRVERRALEQVADGAPAPIRVRGFDRADGLPTTEFNGDYQSQLLKDAKGRLWLPSYAGVVRVDPRAISADSLPPQVHIERLLVDGIERPVIDGGSFGTKPARVELTFSATNALVPSRVRAEYRMIGVDSVWHDAGGRRAVSFGPLHGGRYRFEVRVAGEDGGWSPDVASLAFVVPLPWYQKLGFLAGFILLLVGAVVLLVRLRLRVAEKRERALALLVDERTRELEASRSSLELRVHERTAELARELDERKRLEQRLVSAQKLEGIGRLAGGVAHEINNSMSSVLGFTELAQLTADGSPELQADLQEVMRAGRRVAEITRQLLAFARQQNTQPVRIALGELLGTLERSLQQVAGDRTRVQLHIPDDVSPIAADASQVEQLVFNLVVNARDAMPDGGTVTLELAMEEVTTVRTCGNLPLSPGRYVTLDVIDTGVGMDADIRARLFEPFFTTKAINRGTGLGLAVCHGIVARHRGAIDVSSSPGTGTRFTVWWPVWTGVESDATLVDEGAHDGGETVLLVEDEDPVRQVASRMLTLRGYRVIEAADGEEALRRLNEGTGSIDIVVTDVTMPNVNGLELVRTLRRRMPDLPAVFISGYAGLDATALAELAMLGPMIAKPFSYDTLARVVRRTLDGERPVSGSARVPGRYYL